MPCCSVNVYSAVVVAATCNCIPGGSPSLLNCQHYQLDPSGSGDVVNATFYSRGQCDFEGYDNSFTATTCSELATALVTRGMDGQLKQNKLMLITRSCFLPDLTLNGPGEGDNLPLINLTSTRFQACGLSCPFNMVSEGIFTIDPLQRCIYTVRITEAFKGRYTVSYVSWGIALYHSLNLCVGR